MTKLTRPKEIKEKGNCCTRIKNWQAERVNSSAKQKTKVLDIRKL